MKPSYASFLLLLCSIFSYFSATSQTECGFDERHKALAGKDTAFKRSVEAMNRRMEQLNELRGLTANIPLAVVYRIPVVVHVIHRGENIGVGSNISDAQIQSAITSMSQFYRGTLGSSPDTEIEFELANLDPQCQYTSGIVRVDGSSISAYDTAGLVLGGAGNELAVKNLSKWPNTRYYNIWIVSEINNNNGGGGIQGFAYFPPAPSSVDGAVMLYNAFGYDPTNTLSYNLKTATDENKTAIHEMGHAFSLYHSFEGDDLNNDGVSDQCPVNINCAADGDRVCDTEPHRRSLSNCPSGTNTCGGTLNTIVKNFMDYSSAACQDRFTTEQVTRMRDAIALYRPTLPNSRGLNNFYPVIPYTSPLADCASSTIGAGLSGDYAGIINVGINGRNFSSLTPRLDNVISGYVNWTNDCYTLNELFLGGTYQFSATVYAVNREQIRAWIDYNNDGAFDNATEQIYINTSIPNHPTEYVTVTGDFTVPPSAAVNSVLRLRVVNEVSPFHGAPAISSGCYNPTYGQTEDFHVFLASTLPISLESFSGKRDGADVFLAWQTTLEQNAKEYQIERSPDGVNFTRIGSVPATSNANSLGKYSFIDKTVTHENNYYRLRMVDMDGQFKLSKIVIIKNPATTKPPFSLLNNPVRNNIEIQFDEVTAGKVQLRLTDLSGKALVMWQGENLSSRKISIDISQKKLSKGVYILQARIQGKNYTEKVIVR